MVWPTAGKDYADATHMAAMTAPTANYERRIPAKLIVRLDNGEEFEATAEDLEKFGLVERTTFISKLRRIIVEGLAESKAGKHGGEFQLQPFISLLDTAAYAPEKLADGKVGGFKQEFLYMEQELEKEARRNEGGQDC